MGKTIGVALPFILALILFLFWLAFKAGKSAGRQEAPERANQVGSQLLKDADTIFSDLMYIENAENDDLITPKTQKSINTWRNNYLKAKHNL